MIGVILISIFFVSLPWMWIDLAPAAPFAVRPAVAASLPLALLFLWKGSDRLPQVHLKAFILFAIFFLVWMAPTFIYAHPHWSRMKLISLLAYVIVAYFAARGYVMISIQSAWKKYWFVVGPLILASCGLSYYIAFGTLIPDTNIASSTEFIHRTLHHGGVFADADSGKGIRHTMTLVPVLLLALIVQHRHQSSALNAILYMGALYLILFTFSRSAWVAATLITLVLVKGALSNFSRKLPRLFLIGLMGLIVVVVVAMAYADYLSWVLGLLGDRVSDEKSTSGRVWVIGWVLGGGLSVQEYLVGVNAPIQQAPHNFVLDALMQSGLLGTLGAIMIAVYVVRIYFRGLSSRREEYMVAAAFTVPALVRMLSAGSGIVHIVELFGVFVAMTILWQRRRQDAADRASSVPLRRDDTARLLAKAHRGPHSAVSGPR